MGEMIDGMKQYIDKIIFIDNCQVKITHAYTCYEGDFFNAVVISGDNVGTTKRYSASDPNFITNLPNLDRRR